MRLKLITLSMAMIYVVAVFAQDSDSKQINKIKRNSQYLCAEATDVTQESAFAKAEELLSYYIDEYVASKKSLSKTEHVVVKDLKSKTDHLTMSRGTKIRVFLYVKKNDIIPADNAVIKDTPLPQESVPSATIEPITDNADVTNSGLPQWQQEMIVELQSLSSMTEVRAKLNRLKSEFKIKRYGASATSRNPANTFWIVCTTDQIIIVLGPGETDRINYRTMQTDQLSSYRGMDAVWFEMAK